jgi:glycosyltransferase involved in cell wall biosynthesis
MMREQLVHNKLLNAILPPFSRRRNGVKMIIQKVLSLRKTNQPANITYDEWIKSIEPKLFDITEDILVKKPLISIVVPAFNTPEKYLVPLIQSFLDQKYGNWQLCLADASTDVSRSEAIKQEAKKDKRIKYTKLKENAGIAANTNKGIEIADGAFIGFTDHDDMLSPFALLEVARVLNEHADVELIYSDEDKLSDDGKERLMPFFKPDWSPVLFAGVNYMAHLVVVKRELLESVGALRAGFDGSQDFDFLLRITEKTNKIHHIPKILYHWRMAEGSTALAIG